VTVDAYGDLFIVDNNRIWEAEVGGIITSVATGFNVPEGVAEDAYGNLFIADSYNNVVRKVVFQGPSIVLTNIAAGSDGNYDVVVTTSHGSVTSSVTAAEFERQSDSGARCATSIHRDPDYRLRPSGDDQSHPADCVAACHN
jgi:hypothetical protein